MTVPVGEIEEQAFDLHAHAILEQTLETSCAEGGEGAHQLVRLVEALMIRQFVQKFEDGALGRRLAQGPLPVAQGGVHHCGAGPVRQEAGLAGVLAEPGDLEVSGVPEEPLGRVIFELYVQRQVGEPGRRGLVAIEMNFLAGGRKVVGIALQLERGAASDHNGIVEEGLERENGCRPVEGSARTAVDPARSPFQSPRSDVFGTERIGIAVLVHPAGIDQKAFREDTFELV